MTLFHATKPVKAILTRDLSKHLKRGNPWVFSDALEIKNPPQAGGLVHLYSNKNDFLAQGFYTPEVNLTFRVVSLEKVPLNDHVIEKRLNHALGLRAPLLSVDLEALRLVNGEGDELPGMVIDFYNTIAVIKLDGEGSHHFWNLEGIAQFLMEQKIITIKTVFFKAKTRSEEKGRLLGGEEQDLNHVRFKEHGVVFETNLIDAAKTGFFLDQRENRKLIRHFAKDKTVLNLFSYTGGFSIAAGLGLAKSVTSVDIAKEAIKASELNWALNHLSPSHHQASATDAFEWIKTSVEKKQKFDLVIADPPSFAPNQKAVTRALEAYAKLFSEAMRLVAPEGYFAASSCSGHISFEEFILICEQALSLARRRGITLTVNGQPLDHPYPTALASQRYLKFILFKLD